MRFSRKISSSFAAVADVSEGIVGTRMERDSKGVVSIFICELVDLRDILFDRPSASVVKEELLGSKAVFLEKLGLSIMPFNTWSARSAELVF